MQRALLCAILLAAAPLRAAALFEARVHAYQPLCSQAEPEAVAKALSQAAKLLAPCGISLSLTAWTELPLDHPLCHLPPMPELRRAGIRDLATAMKGQDRAALALVLLPERADDRLSWATVDVSAESACDSPQELRFLGRFGQLFFSDLAWTTDVPDLRDAPTAPAYLLAHEVLHSLSQVQHPSGAPRGSLLADHLADIGPAVSPELCACARRSPYLQRLPAAVPLTPSADFVGSSPLRGER